MAQQLVLGFDIGGSLTKIGLVTRDGKIIGRKIMHTQAADPFDVYLDRVKAEADKLIAALNNREKVVHIGIGAPNANPMTGNIENPPNLGWKDTTPIKSVFEDTFQLPVTINNDANAAALGELQFGTAKGMKNFVTITLGTGLGSGIIIDGKLVLGEHGVAGELGHVNVTPQGRQCNCGLRGCLETYASVTGIRRTVFELLSDMNAPSLLRSYSYDDLNGENISDAAIEGDPVAITAFEKTADILGSKMADTVAHLDPEAFIVSGGLSKAGNILLHPLQASMERYLFTPYRGKVKVMLSKTLREDAVLGPAALAWSAADAAP